MKRNIYDLREVKARSISTPEPDGINVLEEIVADEGCFLTQSVLEEGEWPVYCQAVMIGAGRSADEWKEVTEAERKENESKQQSDSFPDEK